MVMDLTGGAAQVMPGVEPVEKVSKDSFDLLSIKNDLVV